MEESVGGAYMTNGSARDNDELEDRVQMDLIENGQNIEVARIVIASPDNRFWMQYIGFLPTGLIGRISLGQRTTKDVVELLDSLNKISFENAKYFFANRSNGITGLRLAHGITTATEVFQEYPCLYRLPQNLRHAYSNFNLKIVPAKTLETELLRKY